MNLQKRACYKLLSDVYKFFSSATAAVNRMHESTDIFMNPSADNLHRPVDIPLVLHDKIF